MNQEVIAKKKKKKGLKEILLLTGYECLEREERINTIHEIRVRLKTVFKYHIGKEDAISPYDLFTSIFNVNPTTMNIFKRQYWWNVVKSILREMRNEETLFVINDRFGLYVLKTQDEANFYKNRLDKDILRMKKAKLRADKWVKKQKWKTI